MSSLRFEKLHNADGSTCSVFEKGAANLNDALVLYICTVGTLFEPETAAQMVVQWLDNEDPYGFDLMYRWDMDHSLVISYVA